MTDTVVIHRDFTISAIDRRIYGVHLGEAGSPDHAVLADERHPAAENGVRSDVLDLVRAFRLPCILGAAGAPDRTLSGAILVQGLLDLCHRAEAEPMLSVPLADAVRRGAGDPARRVRMWRLGFDGRGAGDLLAAAERLRAADPSATLVLGRDGLDETIPLDRGCRAVDLVSLARPRPSGDGGFTAAAELEAAIDETCRRIDRERMVDRCGRPLGLQVDCWGARPPDSAADRLQRALAMNVLIRRADRVRTAFAGGVLVGLADILSGKIAMGLRSGGFDPVLAGSVYGRGESIMPARRSKGREDAVDVAVVRGEDGLSLTLFVVNPAADAAVLDVELHGFDGFTIREHCLADPAPRLPGTSRSAPAGDGRRLAWMLPAGSYGLVRLAPDPS